MGTWPKGCVAVQCAVVALNGHTWPKGCVAVKCEVGCGFNSYSEKLIPLLMGWEGYGINSSKKTKRSSMELAGWQRPST